MAGILSGLLSLFGLGGCVKDKEKDQLLDGPDMYHVPGQTAPFVSKPGEQELREKQKELKDGEWLCTDCGTVNSGKFCVECGQKRPEA